MTGGLWYTVSRFWQDGGPLLMPLACVSFAIWFVFLRARSRLLWRISALERGVDGIAGGTLLSVHPYVLKAREDIQLVKALTTAAPLLGLLGTVIGMVQTFQAVALDHGDVISRLGPGISRALITTELGLVVAIPGVFGVARLQRLAEQVQVRLSLGGGPVLNTGDKR